MLQTGPVAWPARYRLFALVVGVVLVASACSHRTKNRLAASGPTASAAADATSSPGATSGPQSSEAVGSRSAATVGGTAILPGLTGAGSTTVTSCTPARSHETGVSGKSITIGQVVTDSNSLPQQLRPVHEGLQAFVNVFNKTGGLCGRKL